MGKGTKPADGIHGRGGESASSAAETLVTVPLDPTRHNLKGFECARSERVRAFTQEKHLELIEKGYRKAFVLVAPDDPSMVWGFYTLSPGLVEKPDMLNRDQRTALRGLPIPMFLIGYLGRDDRCAKELNLGGVLVRDAALRVSLNPDIACWGLYLDAENRQLAQWYQERMLFRPTKSDPLKLYAPLSTLLAGVAN